MRPVNCSTALPGLAKAPTKLTVTLPFNFPVDVEVGLERDVLVGDGRADRLRLIEVEVVEDHAAADLSVGVTCARI